MLVTETIGPLGPEENIVELTYHAQTSYPSLRQIIPQTLTLLAVPISSPTCAKVRAAILKAYANASMLSPLSFCGLEPILEDELGRTAHTAKLLDARLLGDPVLVAAYRLGESPSSDFHSPPIQVPDAADAVHLYFDAQLGPPGPGSILTSRVHSLATHWNHSFVLRPACATRLAVGYDSVTKTFSFQWRSE